MGKGVLYRKAKGGGGLKGAFADAGGASGMAGTTLSSLGGAAGLDGMLMGAMGPNADKSNKAMDSLYAEKGLMGQEEFETYADNSQQSVNAFNQQSTGLFAKKGAEVKTKNMILYKKAGNGQPISRSVEAVPYARTLDARGITPANQRTATGDTRYHLGWEMIGDNIMRDTSGTVMDVKAGQEMPRGWGWDPKGNVVKSYKPGQLLPDGTRSGRTTSLQAWIPL